MIQMDINQFLELPDWKKIELKMAQNKYIRYPVQTDEQELNRRISVLQICSHFAMQEFNEFINTISQKTLDGLWPIAMELFVTPKLLDDSVMDWHDLLEFSNCYCCEYFHGFNKVHIRAIRRSKIIPLFGICGCADNSDLSKALTRVSPDQRCIAWNPKKMYEDTIDYRIKKRFAQTQSTYYYDDYQKDLKTIDIWTYFQNNYKSRI